jgi:hypothetical protein
VLATFFSLGPRCTAGFLAQEIFFQIARIPTPINDSHSHRELLESTMIYAHILNKGGRDVHRLVNLL